MTVDSIPRLQLENITSINDIRFHFRRGSDMIDPGKFIKFSCAVSLPCAGFVHLLFTHPKTIVIITHNFRNVVSGFPLHTINIPT